MNNVILMGRLTRDPELNRSSGGKAFVRFNIAINRIGEGTDFINCVAWEKTAKTISDYFKKGQRILVQGSIRTGSYEKNGQTIYTTDVLVNRFEFLETVQIMEIMTTNIKVLIKVRNQKSLLKNKRKFLKMMIQILMKTYIMTKIPITLLMKTMMMTKMKISFHFKK